MLIPTKESRELELAYLAGVMDSDGLFNVVLLKQRQGRFRVGNDRRQHVPVTVIQQLTREAIDLLSVHFDGKLSLQPGTRRPLWMWATQSAKRTRVVCEVLLPYLRVKRRQAELVLKLCNRIQATSYKGSPGVPRRRMSDAEWLAREEIRQAVGLLNQPWKRYGGEGL